MSYSIQIKQVNFAYRSFNSNQKYFKMDKLVCVCVFNRIEPAVEKRRGYLANSHGASSRLVSSRLVYLSILHLYRHTVLLFCGLRCYSYIYCKIPSY